MPRFLAKQEVPMMNTDIVLISTVKASLVSLHKVALSRLISGLEAESNMFTV